MESAKPATPLKQPLGARADGERLRLAPHFVLVMLLALGTLACHRLPAPIITGWLRCGLGARWLAMDSTGEQLLVVCERSNDIWLHAVQGGPAEPRRLDTGWKPAAALFMPGNDFILVAERGVSSVAQVSLRDLRVRRRFSPAGPPQGLWLDEGGQRAMIGMQGVGALELRRVKDLRPEKSVELPGRAVSIAGLPDGKGFLVSTADSDSVARVRSRDLNVTASLMVGPRPGGIAIAPDGSFAWVACQGLFVGAEDGADAEGGTPVAKAPAAGPRWDQGGLAVLRLSDDRKTDFLPLSGGPRFVQCSPSGNHLFVAASDGELRVLRSLDLKTVASLRFSSRPSALLLAPDGKRLYVAQYSERKVAVVDVESYP